MKPNTTIYKCTDKPLLCFTVLTVDAHSKDFLIVFYSIRKNTVPHNTTRIFCTDKNEVLTSLEMPFLDLGVSVTWK
jgi:hypothetical protein